MVFSGTFLYFCWRAVGNRDALAVVQTLVPLVGIILGGYFVQESAAMWFMRSQGMQPPYYGGYHGYYSTPPPPPSTSTNEDAASQEGQKPTI
ncbi:MAG TPA: hypothetical protein GX517_09255 [Alicyclobacillus sp.]|nr:hypothetical protein [Alicyclobacillus sp.]